MYTYKCKCLRVVDGDTIDAEIDLGFKVYIRERIRFYGINTPESRTRDLEEKARGLAAKQFLKDILTKSKNKFILESMVDKKGKFGRILGTLYVEYQKEGESIDKINVNQYLIDNGHAVAYFGGKR
jgi:micrococcal nuclease